MAGKAPVKANLYLVGFMGAGKSTVGRLLARKLKRRFMDTDNLIEKKARMPISNIFARRGESGFRKLEAAVLRGVCREGGRIVSLGGGAVLRRANRILLEKTGVTVYLAITPAEIARRLRRQGRARPLLPKRADGTPDPGKLAALLKKREPFYRAADLTIQQRPGLSAAAAASAIARKLNRLL